MGTPGYANLEDFLEAPDRTIEGTGAWTTPAYLFGRPDSDWVDSNSFLMVTTDVGGNTDVLFLNASDLDIEQALASSNGYLIDSDGDGTPDALSQQFYYDRALGVLQNMTWFSIAMPFANVSTDGLQVVTSAVYAQFGPDKWVAGIRTDVNAQVNFVVDDPELPALGEVSAQSQSAMLHPMAYLTDKGAAVSWAQFLANESPFLSSLQTATMSVDISQWGEIWVLTTAGAGPEEAFVEHEAASVEEYRNAIAMGAGIVAESVTGDAYTIIDGNGDAHLLRVAVSCGKKCEIKRNDAVRKAEADFAAAESECVKNAWNSFKDDLLDTAWGCCVVGGSIGLAAGEPVVACVVAAVWCVMGDALLQGRNAAACAAVAYAEKRAAVRTAQQAWAACCAACGEDDPACHPAS